MKIIAVIVGLIGLATLGLMAYVRLAPTDVAVWHVDPETAPLPATEKYAALRGEEAVFVAQGATAAAAAFDAAARGAGGVLIAGDLQDGWASYRFRTPLMGYPDYLSVKIEADGTGAKLHLFSRARFGRRDFGVNAARLDGLLTSMQAAVEAGAGSD